MCFGMHVQVDPIQSPKKFLGITDFGFTKANELFV